jgi:hypothetical protein
MEFAYATRLSTRGPDAPGRKPYFSTLRQSATTCRANRDSSGFLRYCQN